MNLFKKLQNNLTENKKIAILIFIGFLGILLIFLSDFFADSHKKKEIVSSRQKINANEYVDSIETNLENILAETEGVGRVKVMITLESSDEKIYAKDEKTNLKTRDHNEEQIVDSKYVRTNKKEGDNGMILKTNAPKMKGVVIVCDGGNDSVVITNITNAASAALGLSPTKISVLKMKT